MLKKVLVKFNNISIVVYRCNVLNPRIIKWKINKKLKDQFRISWQRILFAIQELSNRVNSCYYYRYLNAMVVTPNFPSEYCTKEQKETFKTTVLRVRKIVSTNLFPHYLTSVKYFL